MLLSMNIGQATTLRTDDCPDVGDYNIIALARRHGVDLGRACERATLVDAPPEVAGLLDVAPGASLLRLDRVVFTVGAVPLEWRVGLCRPAERRPGRRACQ